MCAADSNDSASYAVVGSDQALGFNSDYHTIGVQAYEVPLSLPSTLDFHTPNLSVQSSLETRNGRHFTGHSSGLHRPDKNSVLRQEGSQGSDGMAPTGACGALAYEVPTTSTEVPEVASLWEPQADHTYQNRVAACSPCQGPSVAGMMKLESRKCLDHVSM